MDTDDLTEKAYEVLQRADGVLAELRVEIGESAQQYSSEDDFLQGTRKMLEDILSDPYSYLDTWNYLDTMDPKRFAAAVRGLINQIDGTLQVPQDQRGQTTLE